MTDLGLLLRGQARHLVAGRFRELGYELFAELPILWSGLGLKGIEAGGLSALQRLIRSAHGPDSNFSTAIFIENDAAESLVLGRERNEAQFQRGLADAGAAANERVAGILLIA